MKEKHFISPVQIADEYEKLKKEFNQLEKVYRDTDRDLINRINENAEIVEENRKLKDEISILKRENNSLGIKKIKAYYESKIEQMQLELHQMKEKVSLQSRSRQITNKQIQEIKELREKGLSYRAIQKATGWSAFTISKVVNGEY